MAAQMAKHIQLRRKLVRELPLPYVSYCFPLLSPRTSKHNSEPTTANVSATLRIIWTCENLNDSGISRLAYLLFSGQGQDARMSQQSYLTRSPVANPGYIQCDDVKTASSHSPEAWNIESKIKVRTRTANCPAEDPGSLD